MSAYILHIEGHLQLHELEHHDGDAIESSPHHHLVKEVISSLIPVAERNPCSREEMHLQKRDQVQAL